MADFAITGAQSTQNWDLSVAADTYHFSGNATVDAGATITITAPAVGVPNPLVFDGAFTFTSATSGRITTTGATASNRIEIAPSGSATTWTMQSNTTPRFDTQSTGVGTYDYCDFHFVGLFERHTGAGNASVTNCRVFSGHATRGFVLSPAGGTNTYTDLQAWGCPATGVDFSPTGGTNSFQRIFAYGCEIPISVAPTGGTNTIADLKAAKCNDPITFSGNVAMVATNVIAIDPGGIGISGPSINGSSVTRAMVGGESPVGVSALSTSPAGGATTTFDEAYVNHSVGNGGSIVINNGAGAMAVQNSVVVGGAMGVRSINLNGIRTCASSGNDVICQSDANATTGALNGGTSDNDYIGGASGAYVGDFPALDAYMSDWASANFFVHTDTDSGNTTSTSIPVQYRGLTVNRTNARATPNKPISFTVGPTAGTVTNEGATITATTGIRAKSRILLSTSSGITPLNAAVYSPWQYDGFLNPNAPTDFTLPVTSHSHVIANLKANTLYYYRMECFDPCGRRFMSTESSFTTAGAGGSIIGGSIIGMVLD